MKTRLGLGTAAIRTAATPRAGGAALGRKSLILGKDILIYPENHAAIVE